MNMELLRQVRDYFADDYRRGNMDNWINMRTDEEASLDFIDLQWLRTFDPEAFEATHVCRTTACIAGAAVCLALSASPGKAAEEKVSRLFAVEGLDWRTAAEKFLEINWHQSNVLFYIESWPEWLQNDLYSRSTYSSQGEAMVALLDTLLSGELILTEEGEWEWGNGLRQEGLLLARPMDVPLSAEVEILEERPLSMESPARDRLRGQTPDVIYLDELTWSPLSKDLDDE